MSKLNTNAVNMKEDKDKWIEEALGSLEGMHRAKPAADLFARIETQVSQAKIRTMPAFQWRPAVAAAILLLVLNIFAIRLYTQRTLSVASESGTEIAYETQLISEFKLYDE